MKLNQLNKKQMMETQRKKMLVVWQLKKLEKLEDNGQVSLIH